MRRSAAILALAGSLAIGASPAPARCTATAPIPPAASALMVGIAFDPVSAVEVGLWTALQLIRLMEFIEEGVEHLKDDVRRSIEHPQQGPGIVPFGPPLPPDLQPIPGGRSPQRARHPEPIPDTLPLRSIS